MVPIAPPGDGSNLSRWLPYVSVVNVDESLKRSIDAGATLVAPARDVAMGRVAAIVDPQGAVIGLARSSVGDPDDQTTSAAPGRVVWNEMLADDTAAAAAFYKRVADYDVQSVERRGGEYTFLASNGVRRAGINPLPADNVTPLWLTCFGVNDPAAAATLAETLGGKVILPASPDLRDGTIAVVTDPSGAVLVLQKWST
jgi:predicted enzyme related to lactoylglutathione lyase